MIKGGKMQQQKKTYFQRPQTMEEIIGERKVESADKGLVARIMSMTDDEALLVPEFIPERYDSRTRYLKRAPSITIPKLTVSQIRGKALKPYDLLSEAVKNFPEGFGAGYTYKSVKDGVHSRVLFDDIMEGDQIYTYVRQARLSFFESEPYNDVNEAVRKGGKFKVTVPSRTKRARRYHFTMQFVPIDTSFNNDLLWTHTHTDHLCLAKENDFSFRYARLNQWDAHEIAAYYLLSAARAAEGDTSTAANTALVRPAQQTVDFYKRMTGQTAVDCIDDEGRSHKRPLNKAEREALLVAYVKKQGLKETFKPLTDLEVFGQYR
jgi:hypothetical protein